MNGLLAVYIPLYEVWKNLNVGEVKVIWSLRINTMWRKTWLQKVSQIQQNKKQNKKCHGAVPHV